MLLQYTGQKGFCEDLDEGKFSFPLIHCLGGIGDMPACRSHALEMKNILAVRCRQDGYGLSSELKLHMLDILSRAGSLDFTRLALEQLENDLSTELERVEIAADSRNPILRGLVEKMKV
jgi:geranylgeranyl diphosphate synthase type 3